MLLDTSDASRDLDDLLSNPSDPNCNLAEAKKPDR
jgi:hypothetical protein